MWCLHIAAPGAARIPPWVSVVYGPPTYISYPQPYSHCAEAVLSFASMTNVVSEISGNLLDLATYWVQSFSNYDVLMAKTFPSDWALVHMPIISRREHDPTRYTTFTMGNPERPVPITLAPGPHDHILFTKFSFGQPGGQVVLCHMRCNTSIKVKQTPNGVRLICNGCKSRCTISQFKTTRQDTLTRRGLMAVAYPQKQYTTWWERPEPSTDVPGIGTTQPQRRTGRPPTRNIASGSNLLQLPEGIVRSTSLPSMNIKNSPSPSPSPLAQLPHMPSAPNLALARLSAAERSRSTSGTPPPPSPHESSEGESQKRSFRESTSEVWERRRRSKR